MKRIRLYGIGILSLSAFVSFIIATTVDLSESGLGGLLNYFWPPTIGLITIIIYLIISFLSNRSVYLKIVLVVLCAYNIYVGLAIRLDKAHWPLVVF